LIKNRGKGGAVRRGMMYARGKYILFVDADGASTFSCLSSLEAPLTTPKPHKHGIAIGSRAHIYQERKWYRNILMQGFHLIVTILCVSGIRDTQCGFKLFTRKTTRLLFPNLHVERWAFDVELLYMARLNKIEVKEIPIEWEEIDGSTLSPVAASIQMARDLIRIRAMYLFGIWSMRKNTEKVYKDFMKTENKKKK